MAEPTEPPAAEHQPEGLDLARSIARAYQSVDGIGRPRPRRRARPRPVATQSSGSHPDERDPQILGAALGRLVAEHGWEQEVAVHAMFGRWPAIVGEQIAQHCRPERLQQGELHVTADSTAWATQLRLLGPQVVAMMNEQLGDGSVSRVVVSGPSGPSWKKGPRSVQGRGPRDTYG